MNGERTKARLVLADGTTFEGHAFGAKGTIVGEAVFTTGMTGYQEVLTDPSYHGQIVTMTAPHIGNTGVNEDDDESIKPSLAGFILHAASPNVSNWRATASLEAYLEKHNVIALTGIDTRTLTRHIRDNGAQMAALGTEDRATLHDRAQAAPSMTGQNLVPGVSTSAVYEWSDGLGDWSLKGDNAAKGPHIVAVDFGVKQGILKCFADLGCKVTVVPWNTSASDVLAQSPDGIFLSNGPGDPDAVKEGITTVSALLGKKPIFGICLGHQILSLALGAKTYPLKFGHRGLNQPVQDLTTKRVEITTQNHGFVVDVDSLKGKCELTHMHLTDKTCEGISHKASGAFSVQYHPEAHAGTHDSRYLFERFIDRIER